MPSMSPFSTVSAKRPTRSRSSLEFGSGARSRPAAGRRDSNAARARRSRLLTDASLVSSISATSAGAVAQHVAQHEHRALLRREMLKADDERQRDRLLGLVARLRSGSLVRDPVEQDVGVGLEPDRLAPAGRLGHLGHRAGPPGGAGSPAGRPASGWWRSGTARRGPTRAPRTARGRATRRAASPGAGPRRPAPSRRSGRCAAAARAGRRSVSSRNASSSPARARARVCSVTLASSHLPLAVITSHDVGAARNSPLNSRRGRRLNRRSTYHVR